MRFMKFFYLPILLLLSSCSYFSEHNIIESRDSSYLTAQSTRPLNIPPGISSSAIQTKYPVPPMNYAQKIAVPDLTPPELYVSRPNGLATKIASK